MLGCPQCGFTDNSSEAFKCSRCGKALAALSAADTLTDLSGQMALLANGRFAIDGFITEINEVKYYNVHEVLDDASAYTLAVCRKTQPDLLSGLHLDSNTPLAYPLEPNPLYKTFHLLSHFNSPGIVQALDYIADKESAYLVLERINGRLLMELKNLRESEVINIGIQLCQIADHFHRQRLVHNGIDLDSFLIDVTGLVKVISFDRVRAIKPYEEEHPIYVTDGFSAPELYSLRKGMNWDKRADLFSIGALLYYLLTGEKIVTADVLAVRRGGWEFYPRAVVSSGLERVLLRALSFDPLERYNSVNEMKFALSALGTPSITRTAYATDIGRCRELNEDSVLVMELGHCFESLGSNVGLYIVSDGMGGEAAGEIASRITVRAIAEWATERFISASFRSVSNSQIAEPTQTGSIMLISETGIDARASLLLNNAILHANNEVLDYGHYHPSARGMGATVTALLLVGSILTIGQVGDSRAYLLNNNRLEQITEDHSLVERMVQQGEISREDARNHPNRNIIYRSIGGRDELEVDITTRVVRQGDILLLCSDGLTNMLPDSEVALILQRSRDPSIVVKELMAAANARGGEDNISAIVVFIE